MNFCLTDNSIGTKVAILFMAPATHRIRLLAESNPNNISAIRSEHLATERRSPSSAPNLEDADTQKSKGMMLWLFYFPAEVLSNLTTIHTMRSVVMVSVVMVVVVAVGLVAPKSMRKVAVGEVRKEA